MSAVMDRTPLFTVMKEQQRKHKRIGAFTSLPAAEAELINVGPNGYILLNEAATRLLEESGHNMKAAVEEFPLENDVPMPQLRANQPNRFPLNDMKVGQSFKFPYPLAQNVSAAGANLKKKNGKKFITRKISDVEGRCWRVE